jgi:hypothetical protein
VDGAVVTDLKSHPFDLHSVRIFADHGVAAENAEASALNPAGVEFLQSIVLMFVLVVIR